MLSTSIGATLTTIVSSSPSIVAFKVSVPTPEAVNSPCSLIAPIVAGSVTPSSTKEKATFEVVSAGSTSTSNLCVSPTLRVRLSPSLKLIDVALTSY